MVLVRAMSEARAWSVLEKSDAARASAIHGAGRGAVSAAASSSGKNVRTPSSEAPGWKMRPYSAAPAAKNSMPNSSACARDGNAGANARARATAAKAWQSPEVRKRDISEARKSPPAIKKTGRCAQLAAMPVKVWKSRPQIWPPATRRSTLKSWNGPSEKSPSKATAWTAVSQASQAAAQAASSEASSIGAEAVTALGRSRNLPRSGMGLVSNGNAPAGGSCRPCRRLKCDNVGLMVSSRSGTGARDQVTVCDPARPADPDSPATLAWLSS